MKLKAAKPAIKFVWINWLLIVFISPLFSFTLANTVTQQGDSASAALHEGRRLLKRGKSDQALGKLQTALNLYTTAKNNQIGRASCRERVESAASDGAGKRA